MTQDKTWPAALPDARARAIFAKEKLAFPPVPASLTVALKERRTGWYATRDFNSTPYDIEYFVEGSEEHCDDQGYAVLGFDGHGINSWAVHYYLQMRSIALFIQLPWGGAYLEPDLARQEIAETFHWAEQLQDRVFQAESQGSIADGLLLEVVASRFVKSGWRWLDRRKSLGTSDWQPAAGMKAATLRQLDGLLGG